MDECDHLPADHLLPGNVPGPCQVEGCTCPGVTAESPEESTESAPEAVEPEAAPEPAADPVVAEEPEPVAPEVPTVVTCPTCGQVIPADLSRSV